MSEETWREGDSQKSPFSPSGEALKPLLAINSDRLGKAPESWPTQYARLVGSPPGDHERRNLLMIGDGLP